MRTCAAYSCIGGSGQCDSVFELILSHIQARILAITESKYITTDNEALKSICRLLGLRANNPTLGVQHAICLHLFKNFYQWFSHPSEHTKTHATSNANKNNTKKLASRSFAD